jgi:4-hydroxybenzoate polyprenyltransferase
VLVLLGYYATTLAYSWILKGIVLLDVLVLAGLYTIRLAAGAAAGSIVVSSWLLAFSLFVFLSLALLKRYTELLVMQVEGRHSALGRGYAVTDLALLPSLGCAAGYMAVLVLALYIDSPDILALYSHPTLIWLLCPLLLYWISRVWLLAHRGQMHDDPVVFAIEDRTSQYIALATLLILWLAI